MSTSSGSSRMRSSMWFIPVMCVLAGIVLSLGTIAVDRALGFEVIPRWLTGGPDAALAVAPEERRVVLAEQLELLQGAVRDSPRDERDLDMALHADSQGIGVAAGDRTEEATPPDGVDGNQGSRRAALDGHVALSGRVG